MEDAENNEPPFVHMDKTSMQIMVNHFTGFVVVGQPTELRIWVVSFCTEPKVDLDCTVRVYCIPATKAALEVTCKCNNHYYSLKTFLRQSQLAHF